MADPKQKLYFPFQNSVSLLSPAKPETKHHMRATTASGLYSTSGNASKDSQGHFIVAIAENRMKEIGIAAMNLRSAELILCQFPDSKTHLHLLSTLDFYAPTQILIPMPAPELQLFLRNNYSAELKTVPRSYFSEVKGDSYIKLLALEEDKTISLAASGKFLTLAAAAGLIQHIEQLQNITFAANSLRIAYRCLDGSMMIDRDAVKSLELVANARGVDHKKCLFGVLNHTNTLAGARLLRTNILSPPCSLPTIKGRQECVEELLSNEAMFNGVIGALQQFVDLDHLLANFIQIPKPNSTLSSRTLQNSIANVIYLKHQLQVAPKLAVALDGCKHEILQLAKQHLQHPSLAQLETSISQIINEDALYAKNKLVFQTQQCFAVKPGISGLLDVARKTYTETVTDLQTLANEIRGRYNLPNLKLQHNAQRGYFFTLPASEAFPSSAEFIQVTKVARRWQFSTNVLVNLSLRCRASLEEIFLLTAGVVADLNATIRQHIGFIFKLSDCIGMVDLLCSFVSYVVQNPGQMIRPDFISDGPIAIKAGRHPILETIRKENFIANDTFLDSSNNFLMLSGPNMSGKSTYLKQVALLTVLAHLGAYVPATFASFCIVDKIFCRMSTDDDIENNSSTFMLEMQETAFILHNSTKNSLILIDELGRGTGTRDGVGIAHALCEYLLSTKAFTVMATHFPQLNNLAHLYPNVKNYHLAVSITDDQYQPMYSLVSGENTAVHYGIRLAVRTGLPREMTADASRILMEVEAREKEARRIEESASASFRLIYTIATRILSLRHSTLDDEGLKAYLLNMKEEYAHIRVPDDDGED